MSERQRADGQSRFLVWSFILLLFGIGLGLGATRAGRSPRTMEGRQEDVSTSRSPFVRVAEIVLPAVVSVESTRIFRHPLVRGDSTLVDSLFGPQNQIEVPSTGSGFLIDGEGHILTSNHVIEGATGVKITLADGREFPAVVVGSDPQTDVAVLRIEAGRTLPIVPLGDSDDLRIGDWVAAVGNPLGVLEGTLTVGVVSAKKRNEIEIDGASPIYEDFIQTDAAINFGNSGGPLVNERGEAVGINTAFGGPGKGLGFAISINLAKEVAHDLIEGGKVIRGYLGVGLQRLDPLLAVGLGLPDAHGVLVRDVQPGTPAEAAGILAGDVILTFDGRRVQDLPGFRLQVARAPVGRNVTVHLYRYGDVRDVHVELAARPDTESTPHVLTIPYQKRDLGLELRRNEAADPSDEGGVLVSNVQTGSKASEAGLESGDVILEVDGTEQSDPDSCYHLLKANSEKSRRPTILRVERGNERWFIALPSDKNGR